MAKSQIETKAPQRIIWLDACKGICIVLVVYGHVSGGLATAAALGQNSFWLGLRDWVYLFHMPAFFALSGYFAPKLSTLSASKFLEGRLRTVGYPYVVWTIIIVAAQFVMARFVNNPVDFTRALCFLVEPYGYGLWFLYALLLISTVFYALCRWIKSGPVIIGLAVALSFLAHLDLFGWWPILNTAMQYFIFYAITASTPEKVFTSFSGFKPLNMLAFGIGSLLFMTMLFLAGWCRFWCPALVAAMLGIAGVVFLSQCLRTGRFGLFWAFLGAYSLEIYLGHPLWGTLARAALQRANVHSATSLILGCVFCGVTGSLAIGVLCRAFHFPYLFRWQHKAIAAA